MKRFGYRIIGAVLWLVVSTPAQSAPPAPVAPGATQRTITAQLKPARPKKVVELHYYDDEGRICFDSWQIEATRIDIYAGDSVTFRVRSARRCADKALKAPQIQRATWSVRGGKNKSSDKSETLEPQSSSFAFSHVFQTPGSYTVTVQNRVDELEVHTVNVNVVVTERPVHVVEPQSAE